MIRSQLLHPTILQALASAGHGAVVLIADGNYPFSIQANPSATRVYLNLAPGLLKVTDVLKVLAGVIPVESAAAIVPDNEAEPPIFAEFKALLPGVPIGKLKRFPFYEAARAPETALVIATGEQRTYACILLTIGVITA
ncbi:MAG TPA: RbsD/FucU family protein [Aggregatilineales bacterium]|nr:RbsD/FucU family protein [Aggregatilineales bacterium]